MFLILWCLNVPTYERKYTQRINAIYYKAFIENLSYSVYFKDFFL